MRTLPAAILLALPLLAQSLRAQAPTPPQDQPQPEARLEPHAGKTTFLIGEPILLDLVLSNPTSTPMMVNLTDYGDNSDPIAVSPSTGWIAWQGPSGHDYADLAPLGPQPVRIPIRVDQAILFRLPGRYRLRVTVNRISLGSDLYHLSEAQPVVTDPLAIDLQPMPEDRERELLRGIENDLASASSADSSSCDSLASAAVARLAPLPGNLALAEKLKLLLAGRNSSLNASPEADRQESQEDASEDLRAVAAQAFASTLDLPRQLQLLTAAWRDPTIVPSTDLLAALDETRLFLAGRTLPGWQMVVTLPAQSDPVAEQLAQAHRQALLDLLESMPRRTGASRRDAAFLLAESRDLPPPDRARAREYAVEQFSSMDEDSQHLLLETLRPPLRDPRLLPTLRLLLDRNPADQDALPALLERMAERNPDTIPAEAAAYVVRAVCAPQGPPPLQAFAAFTWDHLPQPPSSSGSQPSSEPGSQPASQPESQPALQPASQLQSQLDACLLPLLLPNSLKVQPASPAAAPITGREDFLWEQRVLLAARFASPALLPAIVSSAARHLAAYPQDPAIPGVLLAAELRDDPAAALRRLQHQPPSELGWYQVDQVFASAHQPLPPAVAAWLRGLLRAGSDVQAALAAAQLSLLGAPADRTLIAQRLATLRARISAPASSPVPLSAAPSDIQPQSDAPPVGPAAEASLVSALLHASVWTLAPDERAVLIAGCLTDPCRLLAPSAAFAPDLSAPNPEPR